MKNIFTILFIFFNISLISSQSIEGNWKGSLDVMGQKLALVFHIENKNGKLISTMDSPDQNAFGIPVENTSFENSILTIELPKLKIKYTGNSNTEFSEINGKFNQNGTEFPLILNRKELEKPKFNRPQTPKEPFPYTVEEVSFKNSIDNITLAGTLTLPNSKGKFPVVILISGSGPQDRNEELFEHKPFAVIADDLTKKGIAVLRYDDRGYGKSTGDFSNSTTADFANDVRSAIEFLKTRSEINNKKIGLVGHSEGGMIAPMVAANSKDVNFIVLLAGPGTPIDELMIEQSKAYSKLLGVDESTIEINSRIQKSTYDFVKNYKSDNLQNDLMSYLKSEIEKLPESIKPKTEDEIDQMVLQLADSVNNKWFLYFIKYIPAEYISKLKCDVLAMNGSLDFQVPAKTNLKAIENALIVGNNKNYEIVELAGLNHLFQEATTGSLEEYSKIEQTFSPKALTLMSDWIIKKTK